jgi:hypothetical protein
MILFLCLSKEPEYEENIICVCLVDYKRLYVSGSHAIPDFRRSKIPEIKKNSKPHINKLYTFSGEVINVDKRPDYF